MTLEEYTKEAVKFRTQNADNMEYLIFGLGAEIGEAEGKLAKRIRDGVWDEKAFIKELGDIAWFLVNIADKFGLHSDSFDPKKSRYKWDSLNGLYPQVFAILHLEGVRILDEMDNLKRGETSECLPSTIQSGLKKIESLAEDGGYTLEQVFDINIAKLRDREARGVLCGSGDDR